MNSPIYSRRPNCLDNRLNKRKSLGSRKLVRDPLSTGTQTELNEVHAQLSHSIEAHLCDTTKKHERRHNNRANLNKSSGQKGKYNGKRDFSNGTFQFLGCERCSKLNFESGCPVSNTDKSIKLINVSVPFDSISNSLSNILNKSDRSDLDLRKKINLSPYQSNYHHEYGECPDQWKSYSDCVPQGNPVKNYCSSSFNSYSSFCDPERPANSQSNTIFRPATNVHDLQHQNSAGSDKINQQFDEAKTVLTTVQPTNYQNNDKNFYDGDYKYLSLNREFRLAPNMQPIGTFNTHNYNCPPRTIARCVNNTSHTQVPLQCFTDGRNFYYVVQETPQFIQPLYNGSNDFQPCLVDDEKFYLMNGPQRQFTANGPQQTSQVPLNFMNKSVSMDTGNAIKISPEATVSQYIKLDDYIQNKERDCSQYNSNYTKSPSINLPKSSYRDRANSFNVTSECLSTEEKPKSSVSDCNDQDNYPTTPPRCNMTHSRRQTVSVEVPDLLATIAQAINESVNNEKKTETM